MPEEPKPEYPPWTWKKTVICAAFSAAVVAAKMSGLDSLMKGSDGKPLSDELLKVIDSLFYKDKS